MRAPALLLAATLSCAAEPAAQCRLRMTMGQWLPYLYVDQGGKPAGLDVELAQAILTEAGCELLPQREVPTLRRDAHFREGKIDLLMAASDTPERRTFARLSMPYRHETVRLFALRSKAAKLGQLGSFAAVNAAGLTLLAPNSGWYGADYAKAQARLRRDGKLSVFGSFSQGLRMLEAGRADLILGDANAIRYEAGQLHLDLAALPFDVLSAPVHIMLSKASTSEADIERINVAIARLEQRGVLKAIRARYD